MIHSTAGSQWAYLQWSISSTQGKDFPMEVLQGLYQKPCPKVQHAQYLSLRHALPQQVANVALELP